VVKCDRCGRHVRAVIAIVTDEYEDDGVIWRFCLNCWREVESKLPDRQLEFDQDMVREAIRQRMRQIRAMGERMRMEEMGPRVEP